MRSIFIIWDMNCNLISLFHGLSVFHHPYSPQTTSVVPPSATRLDIHFYPSEKNKQNFIKKNRDFLRYTYDYIGKMSNARILSLSLSAQCQTLRLSRCTKKKIKKTKISSILIFICYRYKTCQHAELVSLPRILWLGTSQGRVLSCLFIYLCTCRRQE